MSAFPCALKVNASPSPERNLLNPPGRLTLTFSASCVKSSCIASCSASVGSSVRVASRFPSVSGLSGSSAAGSPVAGSSAAGS